MCQRLGPFIYASRFSHLPGDAHKINTHHRRQEKNLNFRFSTRFPYLFANSWTHRPVISCIKSVHPARVISIFFQTCPRVAYIYADSSTSCAPVKHRAAPVGTLAAEHESDFHFPFDQFMAPQICLLAPPWLHRAIRSTLFCYLTRERVGQPAAARLSLRRGADRLSVISDGTAVKETTEHKSAAVQNKMIRDLLLISNQSSVFAMKQRGACCIWLV